MDVPSLFILGTTLFALAFSLSIERWYREHRDQLGVKEKRLVGGARVVALLGLVFMLLLFLRSLTIWTPLG